MWRQDHQEHWGHSGGSVATECKVQVVDKLTEGIRYWLEGCALSLKIKSTYHDIILQQELVFITYFGLHQYFQPPVKLGAIHIIGQPPRAGGVSQFLIFSDKGGKVLANFRLLF